jgi:hypothetical protein
MFPTPILTWLALIAFASSITYDYTRAVEPKNIVTLSTSTFHDWRKDHRGWEIVGDVSIHADDAKKLDAKPGNEALLGAGGAANLETREEFGDLDVRLEFMVPEHSNSGVKLMGRYEIQIRDSQDASNLNGDSCGGIYPRAERKPRYHLTDGGIPPRVNAAKPAGEWQSLDIQFAAPRFDANGRKTSNAKFIRVELNNKLIHENVEVLAPTGAAWRLVKEVARAPLLLQGDHGPVAFRGIQIRPHS